MSQITLLDICLRFLCLGQLLFFLAWLIAYAVWRREATFRFGLLCALLVCCMGAVVLTMHHRPPLIYALRPILLALTDGLPFFFWAYVTLSLTDTQPSARQINLIKIAGAVLLFGHFYFFVINEGKGPLHDVVHGAAGLAILHVIYQSIVTWRDDLVDSRRLNRSLFVMAACAVLTMYVISEVTNTRFMRSETGSLVGAIAMLSFSLSFGIYCFLGLVSQSANSGMVAASYSVPVALEGIPTQHKALYQRLTEFVDEQRFTESRLTLSRLAEKLDSKEHRLRSLINQCLGFRNFSNYLNSLRLPLACEWLKGKPEWSITDIALQLGYGSITSFNRAFKSTYGMAPSEYRNTTSGDH